MHRQINKPTRTQTGLQSPAVGCCVNSTAARVNQGVKAAGWWWAGTVAANQREAAAVVLMFRKAL